MKRNEKSAKEDALDLLAYKLRKKEPSKPFEKVIEEIQLEEKKAWMKLSGEELPSEVRPLELPSLSF